MHIKKENFKMMNAWPNLKENFDWELSSFNFLEKSLENPKSSEKAFKISFKIVK